MTNYLNLNSLTAGEPYALYRKAVWIYLFLLIFEGALRKWLLPWLATPLLLVRDPIVIWLTMVGWQKGWLNNGYVRAMMIVSTLSFFLSLVWGHHNLFVALFGWRIYFFHFPMIFVMGKVLSRTDLLKMGRFILWISIPMTALIVVQFYSPQTAWVNLGVGGEGTAGFAGAMGYMRPPGTFSFTSGYVAFQALVGCILLYFLVMNNTLQDKYRFSNIVLIILVGCYLLTIPMSISRTHFFQTCVFLLFLGMAVIRKEKLKERFLKFVLVACIAGMLLSMIGIADTGIDAFTARFEGANRTEGGVEGVIGNRYIGGLFAGLFNWDVPVLGYGLGLGTNVGAKLMNASGRDSFGFYAEVEWGRIVGECGLLIGIAIVAIRVSFSFNLIQAAYRNLLKKNEILAWMLSSAMILYLPQGQWGIPMMLGFGTLLGGFVLVSLKDSECNS